MAPPPSTQPRRRRPVMLLLLAAVAQPLRHAQEAPKLRARQTKTRPGTPVSKKEERRRRCRSTSSGGRLALYSQATDSLREEKTFTTTAEATVEAVVRRAALALRDGWRRVDLPAGAAAFQAFVSSENNASEMTPTELASAIESHRAVYGPLLAFDDVADVSVNVEGNTALATTRLQLRGALKTVSWTLSLRNAMWLIDDVGVRYDEEEDFEDDDALGAFTPSPTWVARTVLNALRKVDEPDPNHGCDVALSYVSDDNPSSSLTREIFRSYLDDSNYPYGILTRWTDLRHDTDVVFHDTDDPTQRASLDLTLTDDDQHDNAEWVVSFELSKSNGGGWKIDRVWCERF